MAWYLWLIIAVCAVLVILIAVVLVRTALFKPKKQPEPEPFEVHCDAEKATRDLAAMVRCKTVSYTDERMEDDAEFEKFIGLLPGLFPNVFASCEYTKLNKRAILFRWKGKDSSKCRVMMAHFDVVPVVEEGWVKPAFEGILENGELWGRGTLDTKSTLNGVLQAAEQLIGEGFVPENDLYLAFGGNEEQNGYGAPSIVEYFRAKGIRPAMVFDEGGAVVENVFPGVKEPAAVVGIAEKGMMNLKMEIRGNGGHASTPPQHTPVGRLSKGCANVEKHPFKYTLSEPVKQMFDVMGRRSTFLYRMIFANLWLFGGLLNLICKKSGGELNALVRTTCAFTMMEGSAAPNVIPAQAGMTANIRIMCGETSDSVEARIRDLVGDESVQYSRIYFSDPTTVSRTDNEEWEKTVKAIKQTWDGVLVSPYLMIACSDSRHYSGICDSVYRFSAMAMSHAERDMIHGNNERIKVENIAKVVEFYLRLMQYC